MDDDGLSLLHLECLEGIRSSICIHYCPKAFSLVTLGSEDANNPLTVDILGMFESCALLVMPDIQTIV